MRKLILMIFIGVLSFAKADNPFNTNGMTPCGCYTQNSYKIFNETNCPFVICIDQVISCPELKGKCDFNYCASRLLAYHTSDSLSMLINNSMNKAGCATCVDSAKFSFIFNGFRWSFLSAETNLQFQNYLRGTNLGVTTTYTDPKGGIIALPNSFILEPQMIMPSSCAGTNPAPFKLVLYKSTDGVFHLKEIF